MQLFLKEIIRYNIYFDIAESFQNAINVTSSNRTFETMMRLTRIRL